jgi:hypothetical protein
MISCQEEKIDLPANTTTDATTDAKRPSLFNAQLEQNRNLEREKQIKSRIAQFAELMKRAEENRIPDNATMVEDSVIWNVEALLNSRYGWADKPFSTTVSETDIVLIPRNTNGSIDITLLPAAIEQARQKIATRYTAVTGNKHIVGIDVNKKEREDGDFLLEITSIVGEEAVASPDPNMPGDPFVLQLVYGYAGRSEYCYSRHTQVKRAGIVLEEEINKRSSFNGHEFFTDLETPGFAKPEDFPLSYRVRGVFESKIFSASWIYCLDYYDMSWFFSNYINDVIPAKQPVGKTFLYTTIWNQATPIIRAKSHHWIKSTYGVSIPCLVPQPCSPRSPAVCATC